MKEKTEQAEPNRAKALVENDEPTLVKSTTDKLKQEPKRANPQTVMLEPNLNILLTDKDEDVDRNESTDTALPNLQYCLTDSAEPMLKSSVMLKLQPARTYDRTLMEEPM
jgi:hypothetical protein